MLLIFIQIIIIFFLNKVNGQGTVMVVYSEGHRIYSLNSSLFCAEIGLLVKSNMIEVLMYFCGRQLILFWTAKSQTPTLNSHSGLTLAPESVVNLASEHISVTNGTKRVTPASLLTGTMTAMSISGPSKLRGRLV